MSAILREYGVATTTGNHVRIPVLRRSDNQFAESGDWTPAAGDVKVSVDGNPQANIGTLPSYSNGAWEFQLTVSELTGKEVEIIVRDVAGAEVHDQFITIETYGNANAAHEAAGDNVKVITVASTVLRKYSVATSGSDSRHIRIPILKNGSDDYAQSADWTPAAGDVKVSINGAAQANIDTLPSFVNGSWEFQLTAGEMTGKTIEIAIVDQGSKAIDDQFIVIETFGNSDAMFPAEAGNTSNVDIVNRALSFIGEQPITSLVDNNKRAKAANTIFTDVCDSLLERYLWKSPRRLAQLVQDDTFDISAALYAGGSVFLDLPENHGIVAGDEVTIAGMTPDGYNGTFTVSSASTTQIVYLLATDPGAATVLGTVLKVRTPTWGFTRQYSLPTDFIRLAKVEDESYAYEIHGDKMITDESTIKIEYIHRLNDTTQMSPLLREALAAKLALELSFRLDTSRGKQQAMRENFDRALSTARNAEAAQRQDDKIISDTWLNGRLSSHAVFRKIDVTSGL